MCHTCIDEPISRATAREPRVARVLSARAARTEGEERGANERRVARAHGKLLGRDAQLVVEGVVPNQLEVVPVRHEAVRDGVPACQARYAH